jgi:hypothetical protein
MNILVKFITVTVWIVNYINFHAVAVMMLIVMMMLIA